MSSFIVATMITSQRGTQVTSLVRLTEQIIAVAMISSGRYRLGALFSAQRIVLVRTSV